MTDRYRRQWEALGTEDPYWAVLTDPEKKGGRWDPEAFFRTGNEEIAALFDEVDRLGIRPACGLALDFGCGVGRLTRALAGIFQRVVAVDISEAMLAEARTVNAAFGNIRYLRNEPDSLADIADGSVDFIYSNIVLQHAPRPTQDALIREFCRVLSPAGTLVFQTPSHQNTKRFSGLLHRVLGNRILNLVRRLRHGKGCVMELHTFGKQAVMDLLAEEGLKVVEAERYDAAGAAFVSFRYFAVKAFPGAAGC